MAKIIFTSLQVDVERGEWLAQIQKRIWRSPPASDFCTRFVFGLFWPVFGLFCPNIGTFKNGINRSKLVQYAVNHCIALHSVNKSRQYAIINQQRQKTGKHYAKVYHRTSTTCLYHTDTCHSVLLR